MAPRTIYGFGSFEFDPLRGLSRGGREIALQPRVRALLHRLLDARGDFVAKEQLLAAIAGEGEVSPASLWRAIHLLRRALGDRRAEMVKTVYGRGLRLGIPVSSRKAPARARSPAPPPSRPASGEEMIRTAFELVSKRTDENLLLARGVLAHALERFPGLALAASLQADVEIARMLRGYIRPAAHVRSALDLADKALGIEPGFAPALATKGWLTGAILGDSAAGHRLIDASLARVPHGWLAIYYKVWLLIGDRKLAEAASVLEQGLSVTPLERALVAMKSWLLCVEGRDAEALAYIRETAAMRPDVELLWINESVIRVRQGDVSGARESMAKAGALYPHDSFTEACAAWLDAATGDAPKAVAYLARKTKSAGAYRPPVLLAMIRHALDDKVGTANLLRIAEADRDPWRLLAWCDPRLAPRRGA